MWGPVGDSRMWARAMQWQRAVLAVWVRAASSSGWLNAQTLLCMVENEGEWAPGTRSRCSGAWGGWVGRGGAGGRGAVCAGLTLDGELLRVVASAVQTGNR